MDETPVPLHVGPPSRTGGAALWLPRIAILLLLVIVAAFASREGLRFRHWMWDTTASIRYTTRDTSESGIDHDFAWAKKSAAEGTLNQYEKMQLEASKPREHDWLDDAPLKLEILSLWGKWSADHFPSVNKWSDDHSYALARPLMHLNLFMELVGLVSAFCLVRIWVIRAQGDQTAKLSTEASQRPSASNGSTGSIIRYRVNPATAKDLRLFFRGCIPAAIAVLLLWFNPAIVLNAYGWPAFDMWIIPVFLLAALLATLNWWFAAGIIIGIGTMLDMQMALAIPVLLVWTIMLHGWPAWPPRITRPIAIGVVVLLAILDWMFATDGWLQAVALLVAEGAIFVLAMLLWSVIWRPLPPLRFASGVAIAIALIASPWLLSYIPPDKLETARTVQATAGEAANVSIGVFNIARTIDAAAIFWVIGIVAAAIGLPWLAWLTLQKPETQSDTPIPRWRMVLASPWAWRGFAAVIALALVMWPWLLKRNHAQWMTGLTAVAAMIVVIQLIRPRGIAVAAAGSLGTALLLCMSLFQGSSAWYDCAFEFPITHHPRMTDIYTDNRPGADNLPGVMVANFDWPLRDLHTLAFTVPSHYLAGYPVAPIDVSIGEFLRWLFGGTLGICCIGVGMHARRRSPRVLIALTAGWFMFYCFAPQLPGRYLLFAAGISCVCTGASAGMTLLGVFLSLTTFVMTLHKLLASNPNSLRMFGKELSRQYPSLFSANSGDKLLEMINGTYPDLGYAIILCGLAFLYFSIAPSEKNVSL